MPLPSSASPPSIVPSDGSERTSSVPRWRLAAAGEGGGERVAGSLQRAARVAGAWLVPLVAGAAAPPRR